MRHPDRRELLRRAGEAYRTYGHGVLLLREGQDVPLYVFREELEERLGNEPDAKRLLDWVSIALATFRPPEEAVVLEDRPDGIYVLVIRDVGACLVGSLSFSTEH